MKLQALDQKDGAPIFLRLFAAAARIPVRMNTSTSCLSSPQAGSFFGPNAFEPKNDPACGELRHEVEVFIRTGIRAAAAKRRRKIGAPSFWSKGCSFIELEALCSAAAVV